MKAEKKLAQKGITLIALIVTIIVLLILAGVTLSIFTGDSGIVTNTLKSSFYTEMQAINDHKESNKIYKYVYDFTESNQNAQFNMGTNTFLEEKLSKEDVDNLSVTLKAEIYYLSSDAFSKKHQQKDTRKMWEQYEDDCNEYSESDFEQRIPRTTSCGLYDKYYNEEKLTLTANSLYYISKDITGKEKEYIYDNAHDKCYKVADTKINRIYSS